MFQRGLYLQTVFVPLLHFFLIGLLYAKDVMIITGRKPRAAWKLLAKIRKKYPKREGPVCDSKVLVTPG
jgi:hypothetical protein